MNVEVAITTSNGKQVSCVLPNLQQASGVASMLVSKGYGAYMMRTNSPVTHRNTYAAQSYLEIGEAEAA
jgi:hypothetical protein